MPAASSEASRAINVLRSKLIKPQVSGKLVLRELCGEFAKEFLGGEVASKKVGLVVAPAGYGKSTLLAQSFDVLVENNVQCSWLSLDPEDNNPRRFVSHLLAALEVISTDNFAVAGLKEDQHLGADSKVLIEHFVSDTAAKLDFLDFKHALFIDDYHVIDNPDVHTLLERLVLYSSDNTMFVIASRVQPGLAFKSLRVREKVSELTARELAFAPNEAEEFLNGTKQLGLDSELIQALDRRTEGWVAGLQLAALALVGQTDSEDFIREFSGTDRDVTDYLGEVVLAQQSDSTRRFLLWTSLLERMNADIANAILGFESSQAILEQVDGQNLFVIPLDRNREWYRYHHLFRDFLNVQMLKENPGDVEGVYQRAVTWCVDQGQTSEAINYALRGGLYDRAMDLIKETAKSLLQNSGEHWTMLRWVRQLPQDYVTRRPEIAVAYSWSLIFSRQYAEAREVQKTLSDLSEQQSPELKAQLLYGINLNQCVLEGACDNSERASVLVKEWLHDHSQAEPGDLMTAYVMQSYSALSMFELELGISATEKAIAIGLEHSLDYFHSWARACAGMLYMQRGDVTAAIEHYRLGIEHNNRNTSAFSYMGSLNTVLLAEAYYEQNDLTQAEELLEDRFEYIDNESVVEVAYASYRVLARLQFLKADLDAGLSVIRLGKESATQAKLPRLFALLCGLEIHSLLAAGQGKEARRMAIENDLDRIETASVGIGEVRDLVHAELLLDAGQPDEVLQMVDAIELRLAEEGRLRRLLEVLLLRCRAELQLARSDDATYSVCRALEIGAAGGLYRVFLDASGDILQLVERLAKEDAGKLTKPAADLVANLTMDVAGASTVKQSDIGRSDDARKPGDVFFENLTKRERQMLDTIAGGETNKEIAESLFISEQTVKWHLHQLYQKLGVKNRTSAIARARDLSLID